jgi:hypothetical protein
VTNEFLSNEAKELKTNCEMVWAELTIPEQACGFPGLSISLRAWYVLFVEKEDNSVW